MADADGYPDERDLERIREWPWADFPGLMEFVRSIWWMPEWGWRKHGAQYSISTGGWSGNESIIAALADNRLFWMTCWESSRRGGHYTFTVRPAGSA